MNRLRLALAVAASLAVAPSAHAAPTHASYADVVLKPGVPVTVDRSFDLVGVRWRGSARHHVELRTRSATGWSRWRRVPVPDDGPDESSSEHRSWTVSSPMWVASARALQIRTRTARVAARVWLVSSPPVRVPLRRTAATTPPSIVTRADWGADETLRRGEPSLAPEVRFAVVHHTAGSNTYTRDEAPAVVRGIQRYHVVANGWNDIGYNFLVDRFGTVYEGRYGGVEANVVGAHAVGFNTGSVGVAVLGTYGAQAISSAAERALERLLAWRLDLAHVDPEVPVLVTSGGSPKHPAGTPVLVQRISGHRDVGLTECPGSRLYTRLGGVAADARRLGLPKLFEPRVEVSGTSVRVTATLSAPLAWSVAIRAPDGSDVATGTGSGTSVDWAWEAAAAPGGTYTWTMDAGNADGAARSASGTLMLAGTPAAPSIEGLIAVPSLVSPDADGIADTARIRFTLGAAAVVAVAVVDSAGLDVATIDPGTWRRAGDREVLFDPSLLPDGVVVVAVRARAADGAEATAQVPVTISRTLRALVGAPSIISPNGDGRADRVRLAFTLTRGAAVRIEAVRDGAVVATTDARRIPAGRRAVRWPAAGVSVRDGSYDVSIVADDGVTVARATTIVAVDRIPPRLRLVARRPAIVIAASEPVRLRVHAGARTLTRDVAAAGRVRLPTNVVGPARVVAWDRAGNTFTLRVSGPGGAPQ